MSIDLELATAIDIARELSRRDKCFCFIWINPEEGECFMRTSAPSPEHVLSIIDEARRQFVESLEGGE